MIGVRTEQPLSTRLRDRRCHVREFP